MSVSSVKVYMMTHKFILLLFVLIVTQTLSQSLNDYSQESERYEDDCEPNCSNTCNKKCNKFEIHLRAAMAKCNKIISPFSSTPKDTEEPLPSLTNCGKKLHATLKLINQGETTVVNQYVIIDHVIDAQTGQRVSLLNPYVVVLKQKPLMQLYGLKFNNMVNAEAKEQVINKKDSSFVGCDDISDTPTCGNVRFNGDVIPFSQGFCCSCDDKKNGRRQPRSSSKQNISLNVQDIIYNMNKRSSFIFDGNNKRSRIKKTMSQRDFNDYRSIYSRIRPVIYVTPKIIKNKGISRSKDLFFKSSPLKDKHNIQIRGGQNCDDTWTPQARANPTTYHDSAHCLRFSKLWYSNYQLSDPVLDHTIYLKMFEKREADDGSTMWIDLTHGKTISIGSLHNKYEDETITVTYDNVLQNGEPLPFSLDPRSKKVLVPQPPSKDESFPYAENEGGPSEFLIVDSNNIQNSGDHCNTAGVGYSAFYNQPNRCSVPKGTCLSNQPSQLYREDKNTCSKIKRGRYFLKNFARVPDDALRRTKKGDSKYMALHYDMLMKSIIDIETRADDNIIFRSASLAKITEIYVDSTSATATVLTIKIHNNGLTSNLFYPRLSDCPLELPVDWGNLEGDPVIISPQHHSVFILRLLGVLPVNNFYCSVEVLNSKKEIVAVRRIRIVKSDRCICSWHCLCACYYKTGLGCVLMSMEHYKAAGFIGSMPLSTTMVQVNYFESVLFGFLFFTLLLLMILFLMGLTKALIGLCFFVPIGIWGLDMLIGLRTLDKYFEEDFKDKQVIYDDEGWPVHPDTRQRSVRIVEEKVEFCLNVIFFFTYPVMLLILLSSKLCCGYYEYSGDEDKNVFFESVNTVSYTKYSNSSDSELDEGAFEFEDYPICGEND